MKSSLLLETIKVTRGKALHLDYHNQRFNKARKELFALHEPFDLATIIQPIDQKTYRCRILYDQTIHTIEYLPYQPKTIEKITIVESMIDYAYKYAHREEFETLLAASLESDDILISKNGYLTDTTIANIAFREKGEWITPDKPLLEGTTRQRLINEGLLTPRAIQKDTIHHFDGFALMNAMIGFRIINPIFLGETRIHQK